MAALISQRVHSTVSREARQNSSTLSHRRNLLSSRSKRLSIAVVRASIKTLNASSVAEEEPATDAEPQASGSSQAVQKEKTVLLQGFGWSSCDVGGWYNIVKQNIPAIKEAGFTHVWLPPPSQSVAPQGYLPGRLYDLSTPFGNKDELMALLKALREAGIKSVCDVVINHRCADQQGPDGVWNKFSDDEDHKGTPIDWGRWAITSDDPDFGGKGNKDTGEDYHAAPAMLRFRCHYRHITTADYSQAGSKVLADLKPGVSAHSELMAQSLQVHYIGLPPRHLFFTRADLDHTNEDLRNSLVDWLNWLKDSVGFDSWRFDFVKGYGAEFMNDYVGKTVGQQEFNVGEYWADLRWGEGLDYDQNGPRQQLCDWLDKAGGVALFDFVTKGVLNEAVKNCEYWRLRDREGKNPGLMGWWPSRSVTFIDNHDTGSTQQHWPFPSKQEETGYAYLLTHPGMPSILWEHYFDYGLKDAIKHLIDIRTRNGINSRSSLEIIAADHDFYFARVDGRLAVKLGPRYDMGDLAPRESDGWHVAASGPNYAVWEQR